MGASRYYGILQAINQQTSMKQACAKRSFRGFYLTVDRLKEGAVLKALLAEGIFGSKLQEDVMPHALVVPVSFFRALTGT